MTAEAGRIEGVTLAELDKLHDMAILGDKRAVNLLHDAAVRLFSERTVGNGEGLIERLRESVAACRSETPSTQGTFRTFPLELAEEAANWIEQLEYEALEHEHLGCSVAKTGIYADPCSKWDPACCSDPLFCDSEEVREAAATHVDESRRAFAAGVKWGREMYPEDHSRSTNEQSLTPDWCMDAFWRVNPGRNATVPSLYLLDFAREVLRTFSSTTGVPLGYCLMNAAGKMHWDEECCIWHNAGDAEQSGELESLLNDDPTGGWHVAPFGAISASSSGSVPQEFRDLLAWADAAYFKLPNTQRFNRPTLERAKAFIDAADRSKT